MWNPSFNFQVLLLTRDSCIKILTLFLWKQVHWMWLKICLCLSECVLAYIRHIGMLVLRICTYVSRSCAHMYAVIWMPGFIVACLPWLCSRECFETGTLTDVAWSSQLEPLASKHQAISCLILTSAGLWTQTTTPSFYVEAGDLNFGLYTCVASTCPLSSFPAQVWRL